MLCSSSIFVVLLVLQLDVLQIFQNEQHAVTVDAFAVLVEQRSTSLSSIFPTTFQQQQQQKQQHRQENIYYNRRHNEEKVLTMMISPTDLIESTSLSSSSITTSLIGESLAIGNIVTASLLFGAGVAATLKRSVESSTDDKALKDLLKKKDEVVQVGIETNEDSSVKVVEIEEEQEVVVEPVQVKNQSTETPLETKVVEDLMVEVKKEESSSSTSVTKQNWKQLKKDVTEEIETVREELASPTIIKDFEKDITQLKTEIGNTFEESKTTKSAGIKRSVVSKEDIKDIKDQVQESSLNVASSGGKKQKKRRFVVKLVKKIIMPWKAWKNL